VKKIAILAILFAFINQLSYPYLTINTNELLQNKTGVTNLEYKKILEPELPNTYLNPESKEIMEPETKGRRYDVVFFIAVPVTFYLTLNFLQLRNTYFYNNNPLGDADWNYIFLNTLMIPFSVAYFDMIYVDEQNKIKELLSYYDNKPDQFNFHFNLYTLRF
jgi:hypothetical protein